ncbi:MAG: DUF1549 domain-containing protein [Planctomycetales bacterium]|nr:DUF1549 domain-containing protein [Planctomycetales bacterium]
MLHRIVPNVTWLNVTWLNVLWLGVALLSGIESARAQPVDFSHAVVPILRQACVECHAGTAAKGGFSLNAREVILESGHVDLQEPEASTLLELIASADEELQMPPSDRPRLSGEQIAILQQWIADGLPWEPGFAFDGQRYEPPLRPRTVTLPPVVEGREHPLDRLVDAYFEEQGLSRPAGINDGVFLRRVSLDLTGLLPHPDVLQAFLADSSADKRQRMIDALLADRRAYAEHWLSFFNDLLRNDYSGTGFITGGRQQISSWLYDSLLNNKPYDQMVHQLLSPPTADSRGFIEGIQWRGNVSAGQTREIQFAQNISQSFLGLNLKCASCHDSFLDRWTLQQSYALAAIYASTPLELHRCDKPTGQLAEAGWLFPELGDVSPELPREQRLEQLADLMTHPENGRFARTIANRLWHRLMGRGIVHPLDAMQTPPWNDDLLDTLANYLVEQDYDLKQLLAFIATSEIYQAQVEVVETLDDANFVFTAPRARRLTAEQLQDAIWQLTAAAPGKIDAPIPRPGSTASSTAAADAEGAGQVEDGQEENEQGKNGQEADELMVRASLLHNNALLRSLGRPTRDQIVSMRPSEFTTLEAIDLANEATLAETLQQGGENLRDRPWQDRRELIIYLFQFAFSRTPTAGEMETLLPALSKTPTATEIEDLLWALLMLPEFLIVR